LRRGMAHAMVESNAEGEKIGTSHSKIRSANTRPQIP
jgi:hypothetical protein